MTKRPRNKIMKREKNGERSDDNITQFRKLPKYSSFSLGYKNQYKKYNEKTFNFRAIGSL